MSRVSRVGCASFLVFLLAFAFGAQAQVIETAGSRALGMGGAFVAVASDSSATWWNPAGLAAGPFFDMAWARSVAEITDDSTGSRHRTSWFAAGTPPVGFGYYRFRITHIQPSSPTGEGAADREEREAVKPLRSLGASQVGVTLVRTLVSGLHTGATVKYVRGTVRRSIAAGVTDPGELLDQGDALEGGEADGGFDADVGIIAVAGSLRIGGVVRNLREAELGGSADPFRLPRQVRMGAAFDPEVATGVPLTVALDADLRRYETAAGERRVIAVGAEQWFASKRVGIRAGGRFNTIGGRERSATAGATVSVRSGLYLEGHAVRGGSADERGWGLAARVSF